MKSKHGFNIILLNEIFDDEKLKNYLKEKYENKKSGEFLIIDLKSSINN
jgi:hypothetical protein